MDYKNTLLLPATTFLMRGNLPNNEPKKYKSWYDKDIYSKMKQKRKGKETFTLHDGPPYANGHLHIGHALNKILKDIIVKQKYFSGKDIRYTPGWDCHGLPIEQQVEKKLGGKQKKELLQTSEIRKLCREHAQKFVNIQRDEFKQLGVIADWNNPYVTMDYKFEANIYRTLCSVAKRGLLRERSKPVFWSWAERTALAEAEVEYKDKEDYSIYIAFKLSDEAKKELNLTGKASVVIWTTTPWTIPANTGISLNPNEQYALLDSGYIVAQKLVDSLKEQGVLDGKIVKVFEAKSLKNKKAINPLNGRESIIVLGEHVLMDNGTGCVHTAPGHGEDDYKVGLKYGLEVIMPVDETGCFDKSVDELKLLPNAKDFIGRHIFKSNEDIIELLGSSVLHVSRFTHSYPHCWRSHTPLIYRATKQWFISVDDKPKGQDKSLRDIALEGILRTDFYPQTGKNRLTSMVENRPDWCISRQRDWGVPIAFFKIKETGEVLLDEKVLNFVAMIFEMQGSDAWYDLDISQLLYPGSGYKPEELEKITDILDVWFDSGSTWNTVLKSRNYDAGSYPADVYLEGSDQHRGWFQSSLFLSSAIEYQPPYKSVITHGFTVDAKGEKMSKSKGNVISPDKVLKEFGSEILRLWVASSDYQGDLKISNDILKQIAENYRKLRNTFRIMLANINDLDEIVDICDMSILDRWIVQKAGKVFNNISKNFEEYNFVQAMMALNNFIVNDLSGIYIDITKDRLYCDGQNDIHRRASQSALALIAKSLLGIIAPILTYTADEILEHAPLIIKGDAEDIFDIEYVPLHVESVDFDEAYMLKARDTFFEAIDTLKKDKKIKNTLEVEISTDSDILHGMPNIEAEDWFVVSSVNEKDVYEDELAHFTVNGDEFIIIQAQGFKCPRCWKMTSKKEDEVCKRCRKVLDA